MESPSPLHLDFHSVSCQVIHLARTGCPSAVALVVQVQLPCLHFSLNFIEPRHQHSLVLYVYLHTRAIWHSWKPNRIRKGI